MTNKVNHIESQPELNLEILKMISGTRIAWDKTKEDIWPELWEKIESKKSIAKNTKIIYFQIVKYAATAVLALLIGISSFMYLYTKSIKTSLAQQAEVFLPDNSKVTLYAQTNLSYKPLLWMFSRTVKLEGEGLFEVQKGKKFEVISRKGKTMVLGTQFTVYSRNNDYNVTCISGKVGVIETVYQNEVVISGGQKAVLKPDGHFEITDKANAFPEKIKETQNQPIEEELNKVLITVPEQKQSIKTEDNNSTAEKQITVKRNSAESTSGEPIDPNTIKEQSRVQNQLVEATQNKEQMKAPSQIQAGDKEQVQNKENKQGQGIGNSPVKDKFRASLTSGQISILENQQMSKEEKRKAFMESLSPEQKQLLKEQNEERAKKAEINKKRTTENETIKDQQKSQMHEQMRQNTGKENKGHQKQQNNGHVQPEGGNNSNSGNSAGGENKNQTEKGN